MSESTSALAEAVRQASICNACRYCEGYCAVFPAMFRNRVIAQADMTHLANLCHNCRGCYYACQYTEPHEFALNLPGALAEVRTETWVHYAWPQCLAQIYHRNGVAMVIALILGISVLFWAVSRLPGDGDGFYSYLAHGAMVAIFLPAFVLPLVLALVGMVRYWIDGGGGRLTLRQIGAAARSTASLRELSGGQGQGCNFEKGDRFTNARRYAHQAVLWGFLLCLVSTSSGTILHYLVLALKPLRNQFSSTLSAWVLRGIRNIGCQIAALEVDFKLNFGPETGRSGQISRFGDDSTHLAPGACGQS